MMKIDIDNRLYNDIEAYCSANALEPMKYIEKVLRERLAIDKYGDLNEKLRKFVEPETKTAVEIPEETKGEPICQPRNVIVPQEPFSGDKTVKGESVEYVSEEGAFAKVIGDISEEKKPKKKRTLKTI